MDNRLFEIRPMNIDEVDRVTELIIALQNHQKLKHCPRLPTSQDAFNELTRPTSSNTRATNKFGTYTAVAVDLTKSDRTDHTNVVGYLIYTQSFSIIHGRHFYINSFFIEQDYRRVGLGRKLIEYVRAHGRRTGNSYFDVPVMRDNSSGQRFYETFGAYQVNEDYQLNIVEV